MRKLLLSSVIALMPVAALAAPAYVESRTKDPEAITAEKENLLTVIAQINTIQEELQQLRGKLEEQQFQIDSIKASKQGHPAVQLSTADPSMMTIPGSSEPVVAPVQASDHDLYETAYQHLQNRRYKEALDSFNQLVAAYKESKYSINARYWMGEIYLLQGDNEKAKENFSTIVTQHPDHPKAADAMLKLGYIAYNNSNQVESARIFNDVKKRYPGSSSARLAQTRLDVMNRHGKSA